MKQATRIQLAVARFNRAAAEAQAIKVNQVPPNPDLLVLPKVTVIYVPFKGYVLNGNLRQQTAEQLIEEFNLQALEHETFIRAWKVEHGYIPVSEDDSDIPF